MLKQQPTSISKTASDQEQKRIDFYFFVTFHAAMFFKEHVNSKESIRDNYDLFVVPTTFMFPLWIGEVVLARSNCLNLDRPIMT
jgi:hypothetical protein